MPDGHVLFTREHAMRIEDLRNRTVEHDDSISQVLDDLARHDRAPEDRGVYERVAGGVAFVTFAFGIDGVSMEIAKYARCFERLAPGVPIHCIAGNFGTRADDVLDDRWQRHRLAGADGWDKWDDGKWFARLFYEDLVPGSDESSELAREIWNQACDLAGPLAAYLEDHGIGLLTAVNTNSNPGNVAFALAIVLASEATGCAVISNNHDFYWEGGKAGGEHDHGEEPGPRDHFFRNHDNQEFFHFFQRIFPWNGRRWVQANINPVQSRRLIDRYHFRPDKVFTIGTALDPTFFRECTESDKRECRRRLANVLGGDPQLEPVSIERFRRGLDVWMSDQHPIVCAAQDDLVLDITSPGSLCILQPTRVVPRKRIWRDWELIGALLEHTPFREAFEQDPDLTLTLYVTAPVPIEHRDAIERILDSYHAVLAAVPTSIARRLFQAFSVGFQVLPSLDQPIDIVDIYHLADLVLFPSMTEGRGLPIPESAAAGVPLVCSEYEPRAVFDEVVGVDLDPRHTILYDEFPPGEFSEDLLAAVTSILLDPSSATDRILHNREAVRQRHSIDTLTASFDEILAGLDRAMRGV
jgi:glycosyltransferase involved in cell wall biosynthesis